MTRIRQRLIGVIASVAALGMLSLIPFETTVVPEWRLRVVDERGRPCGNMQVNQGWQDYSVDISGGNNGERKFTNSDGYVTFQRQGIRASLTRRIVNSTIAHALVLAHGSVGISGYVFASGMKNGPWLNYTPGNPPPDTIIVDYCG